MKRATTTFVSMALAALFGAAVIGCEEKVAEKKTVEKAPDGTKTTEKQTVKQDADSTTVEHKKDVDRPGTDAPGDHTKEKTTVESK
jgi:hypothetical protein